MINSHLFFWSPVHQVINFIYLLLEYDHFLINGLICIRSFWQETRFLSLLILMSIDHYCPNGITLAFLLISFLSCSSILWIEWVSFVFCLFSFDVIIISSRSVFVNTFFDYFLIYFVFFILILIFLFYLRIFFIIFW